MAVSVRVFALTLYPRIASQIPARYASPSGAGMAEGGGFDLILAASTRTLCVLAVPHLIV